MTREETKMPAVARNEKSRNKSLLGLDGVFRLDPTTLRCQKDATRQLDLSSVPVQQPTTRYSSEMTSQGSSLQTLKFVPPGGHRACANCSIAKSKCITPDGATKCERCQRMNKECFAKSKSTRKKKQSADLLSPLDGGPGPVRKPRSRQPSASPSNTSRRRDETHSSRRPSVGVSTASHAERQVSDMSTPPSPTSQQPLNEPVSRQPQHKEPASASGVIDAFFEQNPSVAADADNLVVFYRRYQEQHCPMLVGHTEAASLRRENDVLFMAILMAGSFHDHSQQERIASCCVDLIMENIQQQEKRNFKLLEGINCFLAWSHGMKHNGSLLTNVLRSTVTLAAEVQHGLTPPIAQIDPAMTRDERGAVTMIEERTWESYVEECRGLARCYFIVSVIGQLTRPCAIMTQKMQWSQQLEQACTVLEGQEADADACLVAALARLVHVAEKMTAPCGGLEQGSSNQTFIDADNAEMLFGDFISRLPQALQCSNFFRLHLHTVEILIHKLSIPNNTTPSRPVLISKTRSQPELQLRCIQAVSAFSDIFYSIAPAFYVCLPSTIWTQLHQISCAVSTIAGAPQLGWSAEFLPATVLPEHHRQRLVANFEQASVVLSTMRPEVRTNGTLFDAWAADSRSQSSTSSFGWCMYDRLLAALAENDNTSLGFAMGMMRQQLPMPNSPQTPQVPQPITTPSNIQQTQHQLHSQGFDELAVQHDPGIWSGVTAGDWNPWLDDASSAAFLDVSAQNFDRGQRLQNPRTTPEEQPGEASYLLWEGVEQWWPQPTGPP
ncbi:hypothetical protein MCOR07_008713 [Pyricularia oryzae]|uniref:Zn(2)-C6 fungal-type domain-containing protein n=4 Tax=Pyricularia TaxID=48558 RepID=A0ABQ8P114_PYRGI|nr:hypothetical protein MCOR01_002895 [Pyricularia oryzae]KAI6304972.1 hypothetical protein MCOR33_000091 [Pyricularia grisea]KAI6259082.1 hypothetical protein MCOR19_004557 [Pyricularia oryzae]KAI6276492.1 hypothetical protein MCOR26_005582 [Pyricularia oryzae]KAI6342424.1 hypothetical protein MCOR28_005396 [Pyricularia oryzae]